MKTKKKISAIIIATIIAIIVGLLLIFGIAVIGGTIVWLLWPHTIPFVFPGLVAGNFIVAKIGWWKAVFFSWICGVLFKGVNHNYNKR
jgi:hypothetical protein